MMRTFEEVVPEIFTPEGGRLVYEFGPMVTAPVEGRDEPVEVPRYQLELEPMICGGFLLALYENDPHEPWPALKWPAKVPIHPEQARLIREVLEARRERDEAILYARNSLAVAVTEIRQRAETIRYWVDQLEALSVNVLGPLIESTGPASSPSDADESPPEEPAPSPLWVNANAPGAPIEELQAAVEKLRKYVLTRAWPNPALIGIEIGTEGAVRTFGLECTCGAGRGPGGHHGPHCPYKVWDAGPGR